ncbi:MAG: WXG100 family type VII secretion target [Actinomycetota bacterium]
MHSWSSSSSAGGAGRPEVPPSFDVPGDPAALRSSATRLREAARRFAETGGALARVSTDGWSGAAADDFREVFSHEPQRWEDAAAGFTGAASALESHAAVLEEARATARWAEQEYGRGERVTQDARAAYDADVARARQEAAEAAARGQYRQLLIYPSSDPGEAIGAPPSTPTRTPSPGWRPPVSRLPRRCAEPATAHRRSAHGWRRPAVRWAGSCSGPARRSGIWASSCCGTSTRRHI